MNSVTTITNMFTNANSFNQNISSWVFLSINDMRNMFAPNTSFNNGLANGVSGTMPWTITTSAATLNMGTVFNGASAFNQDISSWNMSKVTSVTGMFQSATKFDQNIGSWNISNVTNFTSFMSTKTPTTFSSTNLDAIYNGWSLIPVKPSISISFGTAKYTAASSAGRAILTGAPNLWVITDGGI
jgi:surface protein